VRIVFLYNAQDHHLLHSLPIACALSTFRADWEVVVLTRSTEQMTLAQDLARAYPAHRLSFEVMRQPPGVEIAGPRLGKLMRLAANARAIARFDAVVVAERTSLALQRLGARRPKFIHTFHGSSGHDRVLDSRLSRFDLLLAPSARRIARIVESGQIDPRRAQVIGYAKRDLVSRLAATPPRLFANGRPTVIYNPHHWRNKSSWPVAGFEVLDAFAAQDRWNLIFAPHVRLFDPPENRYGPFRKYMNLGHMLIDLGSRRSIDMTYLLAADAYLGDVSSQVMEFILQPRPCIFLNPRDLPWAGDPDFASWRLGPVVKTASEAVQALDTADLWARQFRSAQADAGQAAFPELDEPASQRGARAIAQFLKDGALPAPFDPVFAEAG